MPKLTKYQCNGCGTIYDWRSEALDCCPDINEIEMETTSSDAGDVYAHRACVFTYCPTPDECKASEYGCLNPAITPKGATQ
jgi:hypothetical protein